MKQILTSFIILLSLSFAFSPMAEAQSARDILGGMLGGGNSAASDSTSAGNRGGGLGDLIGGVANALGLGSAELTMENLTGTWNYADPAVSFKSDNLLLKAGGAAAAAAVEQKLLPYYKAAGLTGLVFTVNSDSTFTMAVKRISLGGNLVVSEKGDCMTLEFKALGKVKVASMTAYTKLSSKDKMEMTFDVSKLISILEKLSSFSNNSNLKAITTLLEQYDGITAGFELRKATTIK